mgnify:CR=1 FL=1
MVFVYKSTRFGAKQVWVSVQAHALHARGPGFISLWRLTLKDDKGVLINLVRNIRILNAVV